MQPTTVSANGKWRLKNREGLRCFAYKDSVGKWTIGYGRLMRDGDPRTCSKAQAEQWFEENLAPFEKQLAADAAKCPVPVAQYQFDALASLMYNIGMRAWLNSTARHCLLLGHLSEIAREHGSKPHSATCGCQITRWCHGDHGEVIGALLNRHIGEAEQFTGKH